jgi:dihydroxy-acid dehydratase
MPEWGQLPIPKKLLQQGVRDMLRISDARMSGTSYGACVLHVAPEAFVGGPLALVRNGDVIELDIPARRLELRVAEDELARRRAEWKAPAPRFERGYGVMFSQFVSQADGRLRLQVPGDWDQSGSIRRAGNPLNEIS